MSDVGYSSKEITEILRSWSAGKHEALEVLIPVVYDELRRQAHYYLRRERRGHTLQTTGLIHEAYLKLINQKNVQFESRTHFFAISANLMRQILVDHAKAKQRLKRGGIKSDLPLDESIKVAADEKDIDLIELDEALQRLAKVDMRQVRIVELKFFGGLTIEETADVLEISATTVKREWKIARAWLYHELTK